MADNTGKRAEWGSRLGFILAAAGSAVGLGDIWKFPYMAAKNGGGAFLVIYLAVALTFGMALMTGEIAMGSISKKSPVGAFEKLGGKRWKGFGYLATLVPFIILSFYSVVGGWTIAYLVKFASGSLDTSDGPLLTSMFEGFVSNAGEPLIYHFLFMAATVAIIIMGIQKGIERCSKYLMVCLLGLIGLLIVRVLTLPGAIDGIMLYLEPDFSKVTGSMLIDVIATGFFSMSIGMGIMVTYGSYAGEDVSLHRTAVQVIGLTTTISFMCGLMVLPAITVFGIEPQAGPGLTFISMPAVFSQMAGGKIFGIMFFFLLFVAAISSSVSILEAVISFFVDEWGWNRTRAAIVLGLIEFTLGAAASLSFGPWAEFTIFGKNIFDFLDFISSAVMMPIVAIASAILLGWKIWPIFTKRLVGDNPHPIWLKAMNPFFRFVVPVILVIIMLQNFL